MEFCRGLSLVSMREQRRFCVGLTLDAVGCYIADAAWIDGAVHKSRAFAFDSPALHARAPAEFARKADRRPDEVDMSPQVAR